MVKTEPNMICKITCSSSFFHIFILFQKSLKRVKISNLGTKSLKVRALGRDEHGPGLDRTGSGLKPILAGSRLDRTAIF